MTAQTSLQQSMYNNTRDTCEVSRNINQTTKGIAENTVEIVHKARDIIVGIVERTPVVEALTFLTGSRGSRNPGQT